MDAAYPTEHKELTIAMGMGNGITGRAPKKELAAVLDAVNLMTYELCSKVYIVFSVARRLGITLLMTEGTLHAQVRPQRTLGAPHGAQLASLPGPRLCGRGRFLPVSRRGCA